MLNQSLDPVATAPGTDLAALKVAALCSLLLFGIYSSTSQTELNRERRQRTNATCTYHCRTRRRHRPRNHGGDASHLERSRRKTTDPEDRYWRKGLSRGKLFRN